MNFDSLVEEPKHQRRLNKWKLYVLSGVIFLVPGWVSCKLQYWGRLEWLREQKDWRLDAATLHKPGKIVQHY